MAITIEYKNEFGNEVTLQQLPLLNDYIRIEKINGIVKCEELYSDGSIIRVDYQKSNEENIPDILLKYSSDTVIHITTHFENFGLYQMGYTESYLHSSLLSKGRFLKNEESNIVLSQDINIVTNVPMLNTIKKYFNFSEDEYYVFEYKEDGTLRGMNSTREMNLGIWKPLDLNDLNGFNWSEVGNYYLNAYPIIPGTPV